MGLKLMFAECCRSSAGTGSSGSTRDSQCGSEPGHRRSRVLRRSTAHRQRTFPGGCDQLQSPCQDHVRCTHIPKTNTHLCYYLFFRLLVFLKWWCRFFLIQTYRLQWSTEDTWCGGRGHRRRHTRQEIPNLHGKRRRIAGRKRGSNLASTGFIIWLFSYVICNNAICPLCGQVTCVGQMICAVVADSKAHAKRGAAAVKITYEDLQDRIFTLEVRLVSWQSSSPFLGFFFFNEAVLGSCIQEAIEKESFYLPKWKIERGDVGSGLKEAEQVHEGKKWHLRIFFFSRLLKSSWLSYFFGSYHSMMCHRRDSDRGSGTFLHGNAEFSGRSGWRGEGDESVCVHSTSFNDTGIKWRH